MADHEKIMGMIEEVNQIISAVNYTNRLLSDEMSELQLHPEHALLHYFKQQGDLVAKSQILYREILFAILDRYSQPLTSNNQPPNNHFISI